MLGAVGAPAESLPPAGSIEPAEAWAACGAMWLTGAPDGPPVVRPAGVLERVEGACLALRALGGPSVDGPQLLVERAAQLGLRRGGTVSANGACRLLRAADGWLAVNLARPSDEELVPAWLAAAGATEVGGASVADAVAAATLLGLPVAEAVAPPDEPVPAFGVVVCSTAAPVRAPLVANFAALWAGPLCAQLLHLSGCRVVKVETPDRPDATREGSPAFFELLHAGTSHLRAPLASAAVRALVDEADVVIEGSRPRALRQAGHDVDRWLAARPGRIWLSITGHGRDSDRVAFGDDAGVAGGLAVLTGGDERDGATPLFCADAVADPLAGLHAAVAALGLLRAGAGGLVDVSLAGVSAACGAGVAPVVDRPSTPPRPPVATGRLHGHAS